MVDQWEIDLASKETTSTLKKWIWLATTYRWPIPRGISVGACVEVLRSREENGGEATIPDADKQEGKGGRMDTRIIKEEREKSVNGINVDTYEPVAQREDKSKHQKGKSPATRVLEGAKKAYNVLIDEGYQPEEITYIADFIWKIANVDSHGLGNIVRIRDDVFLDAFQNTDQILCGVAPICNRRSDRQSKRKDEYQCLQTI